MEAEETMGCIQEFPDHYKVMLDRLNEQRELDQFTDITLIVDGHQFKAHKAVLAACSHFFYKFFQDFNQEPLVEIEGVSNSSFRHLIEFTYTAKLMIQDEEEASDIWRAAEYLQMHEAMKALEYRSKENIVIEDSTVDEEAMEKWDVTENTSVITETLPSADSEPVEIEVEVAERTIEIEDNIATMEEVASAEQSIKYVQTTTTSDDSALALLADITSKYRQGDRKRQLQEEGIDEREAANKQEHMKSHSADNFKCEICNKRYVREIAWKQHLTCYHLDERGANKRPRPSKKIHVCQYCGKQFDHFGHFKEHLRKHTGEKPFECPNCHEHFARNSTLKCHLSACQYGVGAKKGRKKLYECQVCNSIFNSWEQFKDHLVLHTGDKPNHCTLCDVWFMQGSELRKHLQDAHNISEVVLPSENVETESVASMTFVEQVEQVHVLPVDQVIQVQVDPPQLTVGHLHQDLLEVNQVKGAHILDLQTQVHMGHIEVEHLQIEPGTEIQVEEVHVEHVNQIHMEEVEEELLDESSIQHIEHTLEEQDESCQPVEAELHHIVHTRADSLQIKQIEMTHIEATAE
ncbi:zinc finger protein 131 isoform 2-T2 [Rhinophrynus dorsalis]